MTDTKDGLNYEAKQWGDKEMFQCGDCPFSSLSEPEVRQHCVDRHVGVVKVVSEVTEGTGLVGPGGNEIVRTAPQVDEVPTSPAELQDWVREDSELRATVALEVENARHGGPRARVMEWLGPLTQPKEERDA